MEEEEEEEEGVEVLEGVVVVRLGLGGH